MLLKGFGTYFFAVAPTGQTFAEYMASLGTIQWLRLGESSGATAEDSSSNNNDETYSGTFTLGQTGLVTGDSDTAVRLFGSGNDFNQVESLLHFDGADASTTITDEISGVTWTANGNAQLDTAQKVFGTASLLCDGNGDYISSSNCGNLDQETFTIQARVRFASGTRSETAQALLSKWESNLVPANDSYILTFQAASTSSAPNDINFAWRSGSTFVSNPVSFAFAFDTWYAIEVNRSDDELRFFIDNTLIATIACTNTHNQTTTDTLAGALFSAGSPVQSLNGWIDELRITNYKAINTSSYTPDTEAFRVTSFDSSTVIEHDTSEPDYNSFPGLGIAQNGTIFIGYTKTTTHVSQDGNLVYRLSTDGGDNFGTETTLFDYVTDGESVDFWNAPRITTLRDGTMIMSLGKRELQSAVVDGIGFCTSTDNGSAWSSITQITGTQFTEFAGEGGGIIELANGDLLYPYYGRDTGDAADRRSCALMRLPSGSSTWQFDGVVADGPADGLDYTEPGIVQLDNGDIVMLIRENGGISTGKDCYKTVLANGSSTWTDPVKIMDGCSGLMTPTLLSTGEIILPQRSVATDLECRLLYSPADADNWEFGKTFDLSPNFTNYQMTYAQAKEYNGKIHLVYAMDASGQSASDILYTRADMIILDGQTSLTPSVYTNAGTAGYTIREAFEPTSDYGAGTAREVWLDMHDGTDGLEVAYEAGNLEITHGLETYQIATTYTAGERYRLIRSYNATTKLLEVYQNGLLIGSNTFTSALVIPGSGTFYVGGTRTVDEYSYEEGPTDAADVSTDYSYFT